MATPVNTTGLHAIVTEGGGTWVGLQDTFQDGQEPLVLFNSPTSKSTLALPLSLLTPSNVRGKIHGSDAYFNARPVKVSRATMQIFIQDLKGIVQKFEALLGE
jgi:hypothetical protein